MHTLTLASHTQTPGVFFLCFFVEKLLRGAGGGGEIEITVYKGGIHVSVYMHVNVCTMIVQNENAQGGHKILKGGIKFSRGA